MNASHTTPSSDAANATSKLIWLLVAVQFLHIAEFMMLSPLGNMMMKRFNVGPSAFASAVAIYGFMAGVGGVLMAGFADRFNRMHMFVVLGILFLLTSLGCALATNFEWFLFCRAASGATGGVLTASAHAIVADTVAPERRGSAMARLGMAFALASVAGVPLGIFLATTISWSAPFIAIVLAGLLALTLFVRYAPSLPVKPSSKAPLQQLWAVLNERSHWPAYALSSTLTTASFLVIPFISVYYLINCGVSEINLSYVYIVGGLAMLLVAPHIGKAADRRGKQKVFQAIAVFSLLPILLVTHLEYLNPPPVWLCILSSGAFIVGTSGRYMPALALATGSAKPDMRGGFANINNALIHFVSSTTTILLGLLVSPAAKSAGGKIVNYHFAGYLSCAFVLLAIWVSKRIKEVA